MAEHFENDCPYFCGELLNNLELDLQNKIVQVLHSVLEKNYGDAYSFCKGLLKEIESVSDIDAFLYGNILKQLVFSLLKVSEGGAAVRLVQERLDQLKNADFLTLIIMGGVYDKKSDYTNALGAYQQANDIANSSDEKLKNALSLVKMAASYWQLQQPEMSRSCTDQSQQIFQQSYKKGEECVSTEEALYILDYFKTHSYLYDADSKYELSVDYYCKALDIIKKHNYSKVHELKVLSQISRAYARKYDNLAIDRYNKRSLLIIEDILKNPSYISAHALQLVHLMNRLEFTYELTKNFEAASDILEKNFKIASNFLGNAHPEVARIAADASVLYQKLRQPRNSAKYLDIAENTLNETDYKNDPEYMKLYVRELSDAFNGLGNCHILESNFAAAEESYKEALFINDEVYGEMSLRSSKVLRFLGRMYNKWGKYELAKQYFQKSLTAVEKYQPTNISWRSSIQDEMSKVGLVRGRFDRRKRQS